MSKALENQSSHLKQLILETPDLFERPWKSTSTPVNAITKIPYSNLRNCLTLMIEAERNGWTSNKWITYAQAKKHKMFIKKDQVRNGIWVIGWFKKKVEKDQDDEEQQFNRYPKAFKVYNLDQLEEVPDKLQTIEEAEGTTEDETDNINDALGLYDCLDVAIRFVDEDRCYYRPSDDSVTMMPLAKFLSPSLAVSTLYHELAHATGAESRLDRDMSGRFGDNSYAREEVIAETTALALAIWSGINHEPGHSAGYIRSWLTNVPELLDECIDEAIKACNYIKKFHKSNVTLKDKNAA